jgi:molecular chaperone GrpE
MTEGILMTTLKKHGMEKFDPSVEGEKFDPNKHEATFMTPQPDKPDNTVFHCQSKGFLYNGRVLRVSESMNGFLRRSTDRSNRLPRLVW